MAALAACQPVPEPPLPDGCDSSEPVEGTTLVGLVACEAQLLTDGEGRGADAIIANHWVRAIVRHPESALTLLGVGGGTLVDVAPWGYRDRLHEVVPLVDGGWLDVDGFVVESDRVVVEGAVAPILGRPAPSTLGERREVAWVPDPDGPWLRAEGADGLWIHVAGDFELLDGQLWSESVLVGHDGALVEDLGGPILTDGTGLLVAPTTDGAGHLPVPVLPISGEAPDAERIALYRRGERVGHVILTGPTFHVDVPAMVDAIRAEADGRAPSPFVKPDLDVSLALGPAGTLEILLAHVGTPRPVAVSWQDRTGRSGTELLPPGGGALTLGAGSYTLDLSAGPTVAATSVRVDVPAGATETVSVTLAPVFDPGARVLVALPWHGPRSLDWRGSETRALDEAVAQGVGYAVVAPMNEVGAAEADPDVLAWIRWRNGTHLVAPAANVIAWPWSASGRQAAHGAIDPHGLDTSTALAAASVSGRETAVDLATLARLGAPWGPRPDFVRLDDPDMTPAVAWAAWFAWLDAGIALAPLGPLTWVDIADPEALSEVDIEAGLLRGQVAPTTGPLLRLTVNGAGSGDVAEVPARGSVPARVELRGAPADATVVVVGDGGREVARGQGVVLVPTTDRYLVAVAWWDGGWAATGPVWLHPPP